MGRVSTGLVGTAALALILNAACSGGGQKAPADGGATADGGGSADGGTMTTTGWQSGARLRAVLKAIDQARLFEAWHDTMLDVDCAFSVASDGRSRCVPLPPTADFGFSDSACTMPVAIMYGGMPTGGVYFPTAGNTFVCGRGNPIYLPGAPLKSTPAMLYHQLGDGSCQPGGAPPTGAPALAYGAAVDPATLVGATEMPEPRDARLRARVLYADDGARRVIGVHDIARNHPCDLQTDPSGSFCAPTNVAYDYPTYADAACMVPITVYVHFESNQEACKTTPDAVAVGYPQAYFSTGTPNPIQTYDRSLTCAPHVSTAADARTLWNKGAPIARGEFASLTLTREGPGRIQLEQVKGSEGELLFTANAYDATKGFFCAYGIAADLQHRCLPVDQGATAGIVFFSDAACMSALIALPAGSPAPAAGTLFHNSPPAGGTAYYAVGAKTVTPATVYQVNGTCMKLAAVPAEDYYATTTVPPSDFVPITRVVE